MTAQEWLEIYDKNYPWSIESIRDAATIIRDQQAEIEGLKSEIEGDLVVYANLEESHRAVNAQLKVEGKRAQYMANLAASRLADREAIERHVTKRVATECAEIAEAMWSDHYWAWPAIQTYADKIRKKYGVSNEK